jgi:hypothetical protein
VGVLVAALALAVFLIWLGSRESGESPATGPVVQPRAPETAIEALPPAPDIPVREPGPEPVEEVAGAAPPAENTPALPEMTLQTSDEAVRMALAGAGGSALLDGPLQEDELLQRGAAIIDGTSRGLVLTKILSPSRPEGKFTTVEDQGQELIDPASYDRYDDYAQAIAGVDTAALASAFHRFRPLLEEAYAQLGYAREDFDNALIRSLDVVIATPDIPGTVAVKPKGGLYVFADPALEALPSLQKQLLRMGPENRELVKQQAVALRSALLAEESPQ